MKASFGKTKASVVFKSCSSSIKQSCLTFPTGTAQTYPKHNFMRGWRGMNYVSHSVAESSIFWEGKPCAGKWAYQNREC